MRPPNFGPEWLAARLPELIPDYPQTSLCIALSGGLDSTVLLAALAMLDRSPLRAVHIHHGLHANADAWSRHCRALARRFKVPLKVVRVEVDLSGGVSLEAAAREARYAVLSRELAEGEVLLTAHHEDDQLETVLLQLFRGAGLAGLAAMPPLATFSKGWHARPLLQTSRAELESWARERSLTWSDDDTNADERLDRNYLRRRVLPLIRDRWPSVARTVSRSARHLAEGHSLLEQLGRADVERAAVGASLCAKFLRTLGMERRRNALRYWIARSGYSLPDTTRLDEMAGPLIAARSDANPSVTWRKTSVRREADLLTLMPAEVDDTSKRRDAQSREAHLPLIWRAREHRVIELPDDCGKLELQDAVHGPIDLDALPLELTVRWRSGGERLRPRRGGPSKSLKSLLQSTRVPLAERARLPLVFAAERLLAAADFWSDASIQAGEDTARRARFVWHRYPFAR